MKNFWENSPEWQRERELRAELEAKTKAMDEAGDWVLACIRNDNDSPWGGYWQGVRQAYKDTAERRQDAFDAWQAANKAFDASPVGQAYLRWLKDPLAVLPPEQEAA